MKKQQYLIYIILLIFKSIFPLLTSTAGLAAPLKVSPLAGSWAHGLLHSQLVLGQPATAGRLAIRLVGRSSLARRLLAFRFEILKFSA